MKYGQQEYDFDESVMSFMSPGQVFSIELDLHEKRTNVQHVKTKPGEWVLLIHPDFLWNTTLAVKIRQYEFFNYSVNEALFLSEKEGNLIARIQLLNRLETSLNAYFESEELTKKGFPTVKFISDELRVSPNYLSGLLKALTGRSTRQYIQDKIIEMAKEKLSTSDLSVSEIAYELGFGYPQSFIKMFKTKTRLTPLQYRRSFN